MARIRNIGNLNYSRWHTLPYEAGSEAVFSMHLDTPYQDVGSYFENSYGEISRTHVDESVNGMPILWQAMFHFGNFGREDVELNFGGGKLSTAFQSLVVDEPQAFPGLVDTASETWELDSDNLFIHDSLAFIARLPIGLWLAFFELAKTQNFYVESLKGSWDTTKVEQDNILLLTFKVGKHVSNTDRLLQALAMKLNKSLRSTRQS